MTRADVLKAIPKGLQRAAFWAWMSGQTMAICDGKKYNHDTGLYEDTECYPNWHGVVVYPWDVQRFLDGKDVID